VAIAGHFHHGKTIFLDRLIEYTHVEPWDLFSERRYSDARRDEQARGLSIKATPVSLVLPSTSGKSYLFHIIDTPGHVNFSDEVSAAFRAVDGVVVIVDAIEGVMMNTNRILQHAVSERLSITLVINKVDRLIVELKIPPTDAYFKLCHIISEVNSIIANAVASLPPKGSEINMPTPTYNELTPLDGSVIFSSATHGWSFSLESFALDYVSRSGSALKGVDASALSRRLWGDFFFDRSTGRFMKTSSLAGGAPRSFVEFILEPIYKVYAQILGEEPSVLGSTLKELGIQITATELQMDPLPLLKTVFHRWLGGPASFTDSVVRHHMSPDVAAPIKIAHTFSGSANSVVAKAMKECDANGPLMLNVVKLIDASGGGFLSLARVLSGTINAGMTVRILGESFSALDEEDSAQRSVTAVSIGEARYRLDVSAVPAGNLVLLAGLDDVISKTATITAVSDSSTISIDNIANVFRPLHFNSRAVINVSVEPLTPSELPKLTAGLRKIQQSYPLARARVEESGEHVISGTGELALDCMLHDLYVYFFPCTNVIFFFFFFLLTFSFFSF
jgi:116 kDa U5 small nuclear ribonucleoprotein component